MKGQSEVSPILFDCPIKYTCVYRLVSQVRANLEYIYYLLKQPTKIQDRKSALTLTRPCTSIVELNSKINMTCTYAATVTVDISPVPRVAHLVHEYVCQTGRYVLGQTN